MALPTKLSSQDVRGWARGKLAKNSKRIAKAGPGRPGKSKAPADDPEGKIKQPRAKDPPPDDQDDGDGKTTHVTVTIGGKPNTEPRDPMNEGGPGAPDFGDGDVGGDDGDEPEDPAAQELEEKLGDFAEVLEGRADELEELASKVEGDLSTDEPDQDTVREAQSLIPDDLRQELVETVSALSDDEIAEFCQHLQEIGKVEDPELLAGFLRAAATDSTGEDGSDEDDEEQPEDSDAEDDEADGDEESDDDDDSEDDEDDEDDAPPKKGKKAPPFGNKPAKKAGKKAPPFTKDKK